MSLHNFIVFVCLGTPWNIMWFYRKIVIDPEKNGAPEIILSVIKFVSFFIGRNLSPHPYSGFYLPIISFSKIKYNKKTYLCLILSTGNNNNFPGGQCRMSPLPFLSPSCLFSTWQIKYPQTIKIKYGTKGELVFLLLSGKVTS